MTLKIDVRVSWLLRRPFNVIFPKHCEKGNWIDGAPSRRTCEAAPRVKNKSKNFGTLSLSLLLSLSFLFIRSLVLFFPAQPCLIPNETPPPTAIYVAHILPSLSLSRTHTHTLTTNVHTYTLSLLFPSPSLLTSLSRELVFIWDVILYAVAPSF